jgi:hypothetical protein
MKARQILIGLFILFIFSQCTPPPQSVPEKKVDDVTFRGNFLEEDQMFFLQFVIDIQRAVNSKNAEKSFSFYSKNFMSDSGIDLAKLKKNTILVNQIYDDINYQISDITIHIGKGKAVSSDNFTYTAKPLKTGYKPLDYSGAERIYWKKENGSWKIINWIYE